MFGYIMPCKEELRIREAARYNAYYCGLCKTIGALYGEGARAFLNYDSVFTALLIADIKCEENCCSKNGCAYKPLHKKRPIMPRCASLESAAGLNILLAYAKLNDDVQDEHKAKAFAGRALLRGAYNKAKADHPALDAAINNGIKTLGEIEKAQNREIDAAPDAFGQLLGDCFSLASGKSGRDTAPMAALGRSLGRWVYIIDAWDDREKDARRGSYNIFNLSGADRERVMFMLNCSLNDAIASYELVDAGSETPILDNIMHIGCPQRMQAVLGGKQ